MFWPKMGALYAIHVEIWLCRLRLVNKEIEIDIR